MMLIFNMNAMDDTYFKALSLVNFLEKVRKHIIDKKYKIFMENVFSNRDVFQYEESDKKVEKEIAILNDYEINSEQSSCQLLF